MVGGVARDSLLKELVTPGVHLQELVRRMRLFRMKINLNDERKMIDFFLIHEPGGEFGTGTTSLDALSVTGWRFSLVIPTDLEF
jgi:hypothetical protein